MNSISTTKENEIAVLNPVTKEEAAEMESITAKAHGGEISKDSLAAQIKSAANQREAGIAEDPSVAEDSVLVSKEDVAHLQSATAKVHGGEVLKGSAPARIQSEFDCQNAAGIEVHAKPYSQGYLEDEEHRLKQELKADAAVAQSATTKLYGGKVPKGSEAAHLQSVADSVDR